jgi:hypothetical protein
MKFKSVALVLLCAALLLSACSAITNANADDQPTATVQPENPPAGYQPAPVDQVNVVVNGPATATIAIDGTYPSACLQLDAITTLQDGTNFSVSLGSNVPDEMICTEEAISFHIELPLNIAHLEDGTYTVDVNGVKATFDKNTETSMNNDQPIITLERTACFGFCPVYTLAVYADGRVVYNGTDHVEVTGEQTGSISTKQVQQLVDAFQAADYFNLKDEYKAPVTDLPTSISSFTQDGQTKTISNYGGCLEGSPDKAPQALCDLPDLVDQVTNSSQWIGAK